MIVATTTDEEIWQMVMERFPKIPTERTCKTEQAMRIAARNSYKRKLTDEREAAKGILVEGGKTEIPT
jgi:hypothetical protein